MPIRFKSDLLICYSILIPNFAAKAIPIFAAFISIALILYYYSGAREMPPSLKRSFDVSNDHTRKKCKKVADRHVGKGSDSSSALSYCVYRSRSEKLTQCLADDCHPGKNSDRSPALNICITGYQSDFFIQRVQDMMQQIIQEIPTEENVQMSIWKEYEIVVDWSELQKDVLARIAENHLVSREDFVMFSLVCRSWHRAAAACNLVKLNKKWIHSQMPWLMLTDGNTETDKDGYSKSGYVLPRVLNDIEEFDNDRVIKAEVGYYPRNDYARGLLSLRSSKCHEIYCPEGYGRVCWGSAHGWIVTAGGDGIMFMFNPFTKSRVDLPSFGTFRWRWDNEDEVRRNCFVTKAVVLNVGGDDDARSSGYGVEDFRVVAFYGNDHVAIVKPGNRRWVEIEGDARTFSPLMDVTYDSKLGLIFVDNSGGLLCCDVPEQEESPFLKWFQPPVPSIHEANLSEDYVVSYIVKCRADLLLVTRMLHYDICPERADCLREQGYFFVDYYMTTAFEVCKYNFKKKKWVRCRKLKDVSLFVGNNASMWVDAPGGGCVYFNDDLRRIYCKNKYKLGGHDCGVYKFHPDKPLNNHIVHNLYGGNNERSAYCCPLFIIPSICIPNGLD